MSDSAEDPTTALTVEDREWLEDHGWQDPNRHPPDYPG